MDKRLEAYRHVRNRFVAIFWRETEADIIARKEEAARLLRQAHFLKAADYERKHHTRLRPIHEERQARGDFSSLGITVFQGVHDGAEAAPHEELHKILKS